MNCPLMSEPMHYPNTDSYEVYWVGCQQAACQLWAMAFTVADQPYYNCAFVISALKNSEGKIVV